ncbi:cysteine synthase A [Elusimicrobiota bacterium]
MSIISAIGNTPLIELKDINPYKNVKIFGKFEGMNPGGSIKDRPAYYMIKKAEEKGDLTHDKTIIEPTSGNTGIALAMIGVAKGYQVKLYMPECVSTERQNMLRAYGAEVVLTPGKEKTDGAITRAYEAYEGEPEKYFMPDQFKNENNSLAHYETTGPEIYEQTDGDIDVFVAGMGTTGTLMGVGRFLKEKNADIEIIGVEPQENHTVQGLKNMNEAIVPKIYDPKMLDEKIRVDDNEAFDYARQLVSEEGILAGMSSGAAVAGAIKIAHIIKKGTIVVILPDRGERYLSTTLFKSICAECPP